MAYDIVILLEFSLVFQAEDGIRDRDVTGVQTCALPIFTAHFAVQVTAFDDSSIRLRAPLAANINHRDTVFGGSLSSIGILAGWSIIHFTLTRSEERRGGKECRSRWLPYH